MIRSMAWPIIIIISAIALALAVVGTFASPMRTVLAFWFLLVCPGMAFVRLLHLKDGLAQWTLALALSLALDTIVAEIMVLNRLWSTPGGVFALICLSLIGVYLQIMEAVDAWLKCRQAKTKAASLSN